MKEWKYTAITYAICFTPLCILEIVNIYIDFENWMLIVLGIVTVLPTMFCNFEVIRLIMKEHKNNKNGG